MKKAKGKSDQIKESASPEKYRKGWFRTDAGTIVRFDADTPEDYERAVEIIEAGFRARREAADWGMNPDDSWQLACFPMKHEDWTKRMEHLLTSKLGDPSSETFDLEHSSTWIIKPLWNWLHEMALRAENPNYKRDAGRILGELYRQARQDKNEDRLSKENSEFKRAINPQPWAKKKPSKRLTWWVDSQMMRQIEYWKKAIEVTDRFDRKKLFSRDDKVNGTHYFTPLPMGTIAEAWKSYFIQERHAHPKRSESWNDYLVELEAHPFCSRGLTLKQLLNIRTLWRLALFDVLKLSWHEDAAIQKECGRSFAKKFGDAMHPIDAGYRLVEDFFKRVYLSHWSQKQNFDRLFHESLRRVRKGTGTNVDPVTAKILDSAK